MPGYLASKPLATCWDTGRSMAAYQTTRPSFLAASISAGVTEAAAGAWASTFAGEPSAAAAAPPANTWRREIVQLVIAVLPPRRSGATLSQPCVPDAVQRVALAKRCTADPGSFRTPFP